MIDLLDLNAALNLNHCPTCDGIISRIRDTCSIEYYCESCSSDRHKNYFFQIVWYKDNDRYMYLPLNKSNVIEYHFQNSVVKMMLEDIWQEEKMQIEFDFIPETFEQDLLLFKQKVEKLINFL